MRKLVAITQVTLDGVMQGPGGPDEDPRNGFTCGGWAMPFVDEEAGRALGELMSGTFDLLLGRRTYEIFTAYWPHHGDNPIGAAFNRATKYVASRTLTALAWQPARSLEGDVREALRSLKTSAGPELHLWGSGALLRTLMAADLVDEHRLWVIPVVLGKGRKLFADGLPPRALTLIASRATPSGVLLNTYRPAGAVPRDAGEPDPPSAAELARRKKWAAGG